ncbi:DUF1240 domain-containing protein [Morganella morganii]|uniref:DUF1240 domain-containing protein n=1 Tax=Morganella morganii TaxID=582 RepID=UPI00063B530B|nr:DUF1240 domain-containing protein [Morganella morganii]BEP20259.1 DUF1240 domain-containing protein [Morganella morganii subsp. sibonii]EJD6037534.1 DUF1240 domain-containing protein [Morganella morganii]EKK5377769.1 DUF1240 domain-containing protein [Morganella morganii]EKK5570515.1 DUF1240 domain-containing protein [Morganella morganii]EKW7745975.1 DUF1240 domain-containing protein [Morganella morganii]
MPRWVKAIVSGLFFIMFLALSVLMYDYMISLLKMKDEIIFSAQNLILTFGLPFAFYAFFGMTVELCFGDGSIFYRAITKYKSIIMKVTSYLFFIGLIVSIPVSFAVNVYLLDKGYETCDKISWMSPTTYVKDLSLCDR